jgi:hypothetical protein
MKKLKQDRNKTSVVGVRVSVQERKKLETEAQKAGKTLSEYVRDQCADKKQSPVSEKDRIRAMSAVVFAQECANYVEEKYGNDEFLEEKVNELWKSLS